MKGLRPSNRRGPMFCGSTLPAAAILQPYCSYGNLAVEGALKKAAATQTKESPAPSIPATTSVLGLPLHGCGPGLYCGFRASTARQVRKCQLSPSRWAMMSRAGPAMRLGLPSLPGWFIMALLDTSCAG